MIKISKIYSHCKKRYGLSIRAMRWYVTIGILPQPIHIGRDGYWEKNILQKIKRIMKLKNLTKKVTITTIKIKKAYSIEDIKEMLKKEREGDGQ